MNDFTAVHLKRTHAFTLDLAPGRAFPLFEPEGEREWAEGWSPRYLHPADGTTREGMVFTTGHGGEQTLWTLVRHDPRQGIVEYSRVTPGSRMGIVRVECAPAEGGRTHVAVTYALTGLSDEGNAALREFDVEYDEYVGSWATAIHEKVRDGTRSATTT